MDERILGTWQITSRDSPRIGGLLLMAPDVGDQVTFSADGWFRYKRGRRTYRERFKVFRSKECDALDIWEENDVRKNLGFKCIYRIEDSMLTLCSTRYSRPRPAEIVVDIERRWSVYTLQRCELTHTTPAPTPGRNKKASTSAVDRSALARFLTSRGRLTRSEQRNWLRLCDIELSTGMLWAGDPELLDLEEGCAVKVPKGTYVVEGIGSFANRRRCVAKLRIRLKSSENVKAGIEIDRTGTYSTLMAAGDLKGLMNRVALDDVDFNTVLVARLKKRFGVIGWPGPKVVQLGIVPPVVGYHLGPVYELKAGRKRVGIELDFIGEE